jgi:hypothetical protein
MLKSQTFTLSGRDAGKHLTLRELPALTADRHARAILTMCELPEDGGVVALTFRYLQEVRKHLGQNALQMLMCFVDASIDGRPLDLSCDIRDYRNVTRIQDAALTLHALFITSRHPVDMPVSMQVESMRAADAARVSFCSPFIAAVLESKRASYVELETVLSTEDAFNLAELLNVNAIRDWQANKRANP